MTIMSRSVLPRALCGANAPRCGSGLAVYHTTARMVLCVRTSVTSISARCSWRA
jgi:hypothetical protein